MGTVRLLKGSLCATKYHGLKSDMKHAWFKHTLKGGDHEGFEAKVKKVIKKHTHKDGKKKTDKDGDFVDVSSDSIFDIREDSDASTKKHKDAFKDFFDSFDTYTNVSKARIASSGIHDSKKSGKIKKTVIKRALKK